MTGAHAAGDRLGFLDVARGLAALLVLVEHCLERCLPAYFKWAPAHVCLGKVGVLVFLIVSGFIIPASLEQGGSNARFWLRRFFRLFPAYWFSLLLAGACHGLGYGVTSATAGQWLLNVTMLQGFFKAPPVWGVFWTLQLELVIYAACSVLFTFDLLKRPGLLASLALAAYGACALTAALRDGRPAGFGGRQALYYAPLVGLVAQRYSAERTGYGRLLAVVLGQAGLALGTWAFNCVLHPADGDGAMLREMAWTWGAAYSVFFLLLAARPLRMPAVACWLGRVSYSVYLVHLFVLLWLPDWPVWALLPTLLAGTLALSALTYRFVELPGIALGRALERRWLPTRARASQTSHEARVSESLPGGRGSTQEMRAVA
jgi:peptidoglycan/LPS O-acetylase OafA/YrhL